VCRVKAIKAGKIDFYYAGWYIHRWVSELDCLEPHEDNTYEDADNMLLDELLTILEKEKRQSEALMGKGSK
jgi:hypothetical protein